MVGAPPVWEQMTLLQGTRASGYSHSSAVHPVTAMHSTRSALATTGSANAPCCLLRHTTNSLLDCCFCRRLRLLQIVQQAICTCVDDETNTIHERHCTPLHRPALATANSQLAAMCQMQPFATCTGNSREGMQYAATSRFCQRMNAWSAVLCRAPELL